MSMVFNLKVDIGNSKVKFKIEEEVQKVPSVYKRLFAPLTPNETDIEKCVVNLLDELNVHITSSSIKRSGQFLVGKRAMNSAKDTTTMDIEEGGKHEDDLPIIHLVSIVAAKAIQKEFGETRNLPKTLDVKVNLTTAIPASEWKPEHARELEKRFVEKPHIAIVDVAEEKVTVTVNFEKATVTREGIPPLFRMIRAIADGDHKMFSRYVEFCKNELGYSEEEIQKLLTIEVFSKKKILHGDIGDGTTEYIYTDGLNPVPDSCTGERRGIGHALLEAIKLLQNNRPGIGEITRQQFAEFLLQVEHKFHKEAKGFFYETRFVQAENILSDIRKKYKNNTASEAEVIAIYGGGSIALEDDLKKELVSFCKKNKLELLWIPAEYAVDMNIEGLDVLANEVLV
ncbi:ParM/StbA family protein [Bacillus sp. 105MF]|uniref:ParM/StbA family protein n=1 Tax=Bacillus sp. 105MF TaxID=1151120 RepID=UPI00037A06B4|nr:ParM/StbA family protein [Bacillus sp. 105MF]